MNEKPIAVPLDLWERIRDEASGMGVPPEWVLRAAIAMALKPDDDRALELVLTVEDEAASAKCRVRGAPYEAPPTPEWDTVAMSEGDPRAVKR